MIARRSLGSTVIDTPLTAVRAPKLWVRFRIWSSDVMPGARSGDFRSFHRSPRRRGGASARNATERADDPPGREEHEQDEGQSEDEHPSLRVGADEALKQDEGRGTQPTAEERARSADDHHQERLARGRPQERIRRDRSDELRVQRAGDAGDGPRDDEGEQLVTPDRVADRLHARFVLADPPEHVAEGRPYDPPQRERGEGHEDDQVEVKTTGITEVE